jgi:hypothetical protein
MKKNPLELLEREEIIEKLQKAGYAELIDILLSNEGKVYTKKGRLNKSGACRVLGWKSKQLEDALEMCKELLSREFGD